VPERLHACARGGANATNQPRAPSAEPAQDPSSYCSAAPFTHPPPAPFPRTVKTQKVLLAGKRCPPLHRHIATAQHLPAPSITAPLRSLCALSQHLQRTPSSEGEKHGGKHDNKILPRQAKKPEKHTLALLRRLQKGPQESGADPEGASERATGLRPCGGSRLREAAARRV